MKIIIQENCTEIWWRDVTNGAGMACTDYAKNGKQDEIIAALENALQQAKAERHFWGDHAFPFGGSSCSTAESETIKHDASITIGINVDTNSLTALESQLTRIAELYERIRKSQQQGERMEIRGDQINVYDAGGNLRVRMGPIDSTTAQPYRTAFTVNAGQVFIGDALVKDAVISNCILSSELDKERQDYLKREVQAIIEREMQAGGKLHSAMIRR